MYRSFLTAKKKETDKTSNCVGEMGPYSGRRKYSGSKETDKTSNCVGEMGPYSGRGKYSGSKELYIT